MSRDPVEGWCEQQAIAKLASWSWWWEQSLSGNLLTLVQWQTVCRSGVRATILYSNRQSITKLRPGRVFDPPGPGHSILSRTIVTWAQKYYLPYQLVPFPATSQLTVAVNGMEWITNDMQMTSYRQWSLRLRLRCPHGHNRSRAAKYDTVWGTY